MTDDVRDVPRGDTEALAGMIAHLRANVGFGQDGDSTDKGWARYLVARGVRLDPPPDPRPTDQRFGYPLNPQFPEKCNGCGRWLLMENLYVDDGCPCNTPRGVNFKPQPCATCGTDNCVKPAHRLAELFGFVRGAPTGPSAADGQYAPPDELIVALRRALAPDVEPS